MKARNLAPPNNKIKFINENFNYIDAALAEELYEDVEDLHTIILELHSSLYDLNENNKK